METPEVSVEIVPGETDETPDPIIAIAGTVGRVESALTNISERLANAERRQDELWNNQQAIAATASTAETVAEQAQETAQEAIAEAEAVPEVEPASEVLTLDVSEPEKESEPEPLPKRPRGTFWEHL